MFIRHNLLAILWSIVIIVLCCIPGKEFPDASILKIPHFDKFVHFTFYFVLMVFTLKGLSEQNKIKTLANNFVFISLLYGISLGVIIEFIQHYFIPFRDGNLFDGLANILGSFLGLLFVKRRLLPNFLLLNH